MSWTPQHTRALRAAFQNVSRLPLGGIRALCAFAHDPQGDPELWFGDLGAEDLAIAQVALEKLREGRRDYVAEVQQVYTHWQQTLGYQKHQLTPARHRTIVSRLKAGYTPEQLCSIISWVATDEFRRGKYDDINSLFRSDARVDDNLMRAEQVGTPTKLSSQLRQIPLATPATPLRQWDPVAKAWTDA